MEPRAKKAGILSLLFMGLGQIYNGQYIKGIIFTVFEVLYIKFIIPFSVFGIHGIITLGDKPQIIQDGKIIPGDHSVFLLIAGILSILFALVFVVLYILNVNDAYKVGTLKTCGKKPNNFKETLGILSGKGFPYVLLAPAIAFILLFDVLPIIFGFLVSFTNYSGPNHLPPRNLVSWVGFDNFINLLKMETWSHTFWGVTAWTFIWAIAAALSTFFFGLLLAVLINANGIKLKRVWRTIYIIPWAMPSFISILIMRIIFNGQFGPINHYLNILGLENIPWLTEPLLAKVMCIVVNLWFGMPYYMALSSGVIAGIPKDLYESARVEGAGARSTFWKITFPMVMFSTAPLIIVSFGFNFNNFNMIYLLTEGNPVNNNFTFAGHTDILISWIFKLTMDRQQYNTASMIFFIIFIFISIISVYSLKRTRSFREEDMMG